MDRWKNSIARAGQGIRETRKGEARRGRWVRLAASLFTGAKELGGGERERERKRDVCV